MSTDLVRETTACEQRGGIWDYVSPSRLSLWARCPLAYRLRYVDRIETATSASLFLGKRVHAGLERYYRHRQLGITLSVDAVTGWMEQTWQAAVEEAHVESPGPFDNESLRWQAAGLVAAYLAEVSADEPRPLAVEATMEVPLIDPLSGEDLGIPLLGIVDLVLDEPGGASIIDFKTAASGGALVEIQHEVQLTSYSYAYRRTTGRREGSLQIRRLVKTRTPRIEYHAFPGRTPGHFRRLFGLIRAYLEDLERGRFIYRPGPACAMCEFRDRACRAWEG